jgi:hypothetical protein
MREVDGHDAYPVLPRTIPIAQDSPTIKSDVIRLIINAMPIPDDSTAWEQILEYRRDPDSRRKLLALRKWITDVSRRALKPAEVEEELEFLLGEYQAHLNLHRIKTNARTLETLVVTGAETVAGLLTFEWGRAARALFSLKNRQVTLLEGELALPGREVAFVMKAKERFDGS